MVEIEGTFYYQEWHHQCPEISFSGPKEPQILVSEPQSTTSMVVLLNALQRKVTFIKTIHQKQ